MTKDEEELSLRCDFSVNRKCFSTEMMKDEEEFVIHLSLRCDFPVNRRFIFYLYQLTSNQFFVVEIDDKLVFNLHFILSSSIL